MEGSEWCVVPNGEVNGGPNGEDGSPYVYLDVVI